MLSSPEHQIIPYRRYTVSHGSLTEAQVDAVNKLPGQLRLAFLETAARERQRYWQRSRDALMAYGRRRTREERDLYRDTTAVLEQHRQATYTSDIDAVCQLYARLKREIMGVLQKPPSSPLDHNRLILHVTETRCESLQEWRLVYSYLCMTLQALQYEMIQSGWSSYYYITRSDHGHDNDTSMSNIYFMCDFNE